MSFSWLSILTLCRTLLTIGLGFLSETISFEVLYLTISCRSFSGFFWRLVFLKPHHWI